MSRGLMGALGALAVIVVAGVIWVMPFGGETPQGPDTDLLPMTLSESDMPLGAPDAPVTVIEYSSFTCPHCKDFHLQVLPQIKAEYIDTGKVRFAFREAYFDRYGLWASLIARCGGPLRYHGMVNLIFERQADWVRGAPQEIEASLRTIGKVAGLGDAEMDTCLNDVARAETLLAWYNGNIDAHQVEATPSFVINGVKYSNMSYAAFKDVFDGLLTE